MHTPRLEIDLGRIEHNVRALRKLYGSRGIRITAVTKGVCAVPQVARALLHAGIPSLGDSRLHNIRNLRRAGIQAELMLIRSPMLSQAAEVVEWADVSLNSEVAVIRALSECAVKRGKRHRVILMIELGDLREGILAENVKQVVAETLNLPGIDLCGIGTNLACFGGIKPTDDKMQLLTAIADDVEQRFSIDLRIVSGGNSANYQWFISAPDVGRVNHLRIGESILLGCDPLTRQPIPGLYTDAFTLVAEVIELKTKPSRPDGETAQNAFGHVPHFDDNGDRTRAILALGRQDVDVSAIKPHIKADILGASSDHLILDVTETNLRLGDEVRFVPAYSALLRATTSPYVAKEYRPQFDVLENAQRRRRLAQRSVYRFPSVRA
ncbi:MAG: alanine/ornithine racemase family PLP-dependent enzyme [Anaerolineae bacterium]|nr:alanine/ornithine racemase family PLP-dependent enzyme [Anaerolineae bacterium]